jgi:hypothetical protein
MVLAGQARAQDETSLVTVGAPARQLLELGIALEHAEHQGDRTTFAATPWEREQLERAGVPYHVVVRDLGAFYAARLRAESELWAGSNPADAPGFGFGTMGGYYTWTEMVAKLDEMRANYPGLVTLKQSLGASREGRPIWMVKISDHADSQEEDEPGGSVHGLDARARADRHGSRALHDVPPARALRHRPRGHVSGRHARALLRARREPRRLRLQPDDESRRRRDVAQEPLEQRRAECSAST